MEITYLLEYIWIDADQSLRSKTKILKSIDLNMSNLPLWTFDGSSTGQAKGYDSDIILKPCAIYKDPFRVSSDLKKCFLVMCETYNKNMAPHKTNHRYECNKVLSEIDKEIEPWFGIEQEYIICSKESNLPYNWKSMADPGCGPQGPYYCSCGGNKAFGRALVEDHLDKCLDAGIKVCGINSEVMPSQWEFQIGPLSGLDVSDQLWVARYILNRVSENYGCWINYHPKPFSGDWNGSGCHTNFSTLKMRSENGYGEIIMACEKLSKKHEEHLKVYGKENEKRLTGQHETSSMESFSYGVAHRGCSVRIPLGVVMDKSGYLEDRRPASNMDPYKVVKQIISTVCL